MRDRRGTGAGPGAARRVSIGDATTDWGRWRLGRTWTDGRMDRHTHGPITQAHAPSAMPRLAGGPSHRSAGPRWYGLACVIGNAADNALLHRQTLAPADLDRHSAPGPRVPTGPPSWLDCCDASGICSAVTGRYSTSSFGYGVKLFIRPCLSETAHRPFTAGTTAATAATEEADALAAAPAAVSSCFDLIAATTAAAVTTTTTFLTARMPTTAAAIHCFDHITALCATAAAPQRGSWPQLGLPNG